MEHALLTVISTHEMALSKAAQRRTWDAFLAGGTLHSSRAATLPYIIRRCEQEQIPYVLTAHPGIGGGYFIAPHPKVGITVQKDYSKVGLEQD
jgi:hypothetical protein